VSAVHFTEREKVMTATSNNRQNVIRFRISRYQTKGTTFYRVVANIPGFGPAYLVKPEGDCSFPNRSAAIKACKRRALTLGYLPEIVFGNTTRSKTTTAS